jgi:ABC-type dipeptide/oligopeptide/nickel transport system permease component
MAFLLTFLVRRLLQGAVIVLLISFTIFALLRIVPGDPVRLMLGPMTPDNVVEEQAQKLGLRDPIPVQYAHYLVSVLKGDLGTSFIRAPSGAFVAGGRDPSTGQRASVLSLISESLPYTLQLAGLALVLTVLIAFPIGIWGGRRPGQWPGHFALYASSVFVSMPNFWLGTVLALVFTAQLRWVPSIGYHGFAYTILPAIVIAIEMAPLFIRSLSVSVSASMQQPFVEIGRLRGLSDRRLFYHHVLRNSAVPILNLFGVQLGALLGGVLIVEYIFSYPGLGFTTVQAVLQRDFPTIQGIAMLTSSVFVVINIMVDLISAYIDPRLEY